jgi:2-oxoisovalerate dehydrogenase E1 component
MVGPAIARLVVHEDTRTDGFAAEIMAPLASEAFTDLDAPVARLTTPNCPIPYNVGMMDAVLPSIQEIQAAMQDLLDF